MASEQETQSIDPLVLLPSEIVLRILDFCNVSSLASLTRLAKSWNIFIDHTHQNAIYAPHVLPLPHLLDAQGPKDLSSYSTSSLAFSPYFKDIECWKELCRRQRLLSASWERTSPSSSNTTIAQPITRESTVQIGSDPIWRFRPDFKHRIILSTSQMGGMNVTDMDNGERLWSLDPDSVRPFAHLEYDDGTAVWDREGNAVEVWRTGLDGLARGEFRRVAILECERMTRGFQLSYGTLCVVSSEGEGYVYDMAGEPELQRTIDIPDTAVGHLDQCEDVVAYSMGTRGYHFYTKATGKALGILHPHPRSFPDGIDTYHILHPTSALDCKLGVTNLPAINPNNPSTEAKSPSTSRTAPLEIKPGPLPRQPGGTSISFEDDEWGAGMLNANLFVGVSRGGRVFICSNWRAALAQPTEPESELDQNPTTDPVPASKSAILECDSDGSTFDLGGWLSVRNHRILFEIQDRCYVVGLTDEDTVMPTSPSPSSSSRPSSSLRPSFALATSSAAQLAVPVSFMALYDDCIMSTYTTLRYRTRDGGIGAALQNPDVPPHMNPQPRARILPTKIIRVISLAPALDGSDEDAIASQRPRGPEDGEDTMPPVNAMRAELYQLIAMLGGEPEIEEDLEVEVEEDVLDELGFGDGAEEGEEAEDVAMGEDGDGWEGVD